ncbi:HAD-IA family hydrolase [Micromonospora radicis]|uniref:HAD family hydrolase n=1 Tax=Micromonospora radicis TaxID=1894971 RepID=A0A418MQ34_9ACTN|nr:HAD-IA family hydrolase [Micromonospora radicis]RIV34583.1 HAD family hydrolase [Micromonospora radicis]
MTASRALLLDCDGVLAETERDSHLPAFNHAFSELGIPVQWTAEEYGPLLRIGGGKERMRTLVTEHPEAGLPTDAAELDAVIARLHAVKTAEYVRLVTQGLPGRPGIRRIVAEALDAGWQVAIASTSALPSVRAVADSVLGSDLVERLSGIFAGDIVANKKPAPDIYRYALTVLGRSPQQAVVVEDSQSGAAAAAAAGIAHVVTVSAYTHEDDFPAATAVLSDLGEPGRPATVLAGDLALHDGIVGLATLEAVLVG